MKNIEIENIESRRGFLKKMAYVAPAVITLGALNAQAGTAVGSSVFSTNVYVGTTQTTANFVGVATVTGHEGVVDSGSFTDTNTAAVTTQYTAADVNANVKPIYRYWDDFKQYFGAIN